MKNGIKGSMEAQVLLLGHSDIFISVALLPLYLFVPENTLNLLLYRHK